MRSGLHIAAVVLGLLTATTPAGAQEVPSPIIDLWSFHREMPAPEQPRWNGYGELSLRLDFHTQSVGARSATSLSSIVRGAFQSQSPWGFRAEIGMSLADLVDARRAETFMRLGNATLAAVHQLRLPSLHGTIATSFVVPLAAVRDTAPPEEQIAVRTAYALSRAVRGGRRPWMFAPEQFGFIADADLLLLPSSPFGLVLDAELGVLGPAGNETENFRAVAGVAAGPALSFEDVARISLALSLAYVEGDDELQTMLRLAARFESNTLYMESLLSLNLDEPFGPAFTSGAIWGLSLAAGARFPT